MENYTMTLKVALSRIKVNVKKWLSCVRLFATQWTVRSMEFSRPEHWSGQPSLLQGIFPTQGSNWGLLHYRQTLYQLSYQGSSWAPARLPGGTLHNSGSAECEYWLLSDLKYVLEYVSLFHFWNYV